MSADITQTPITKKKLTFKQRRWLKEYYRTGSGTEAAMIAYDVKNRTVASHIGSENVRKLSFNDILEGAGLSDEYLANKTRKLLEAKKPVSLHWDNVKQEPQIRVVDDNQTQAKALEITLKLKNKIHDNPMVQINNFIPLLGGDSSKNDLPADNSDKQDPKS